MPLTEAVKDGFSRYLPFRPPTLPSSSPAGAALLRGAPRTGRTCPPKVRYL